MCVQHIGKCSLHWGAIRSTLESYLEYIGGFHGNYWGGITEYFGGLSLSAMGRGGYQEYIGSAQYNSNTLKDKYDTVWGTEHLRVSKYIGRKQEQIVLNNVLY